MYKIAFIKFGGMANGGTEKVLQTIAANLPQDQFQVDYFYCDAAPYIGSDFKHSDTDPIRLKFMEDSGVNLIKFNTQFKDVTTPLHNWVGTNFWEVFKEEDYDLIQTGRSGHPEYPFCYIHNTPIIDSIHLAGMAERKNNVFKTILVGKKQRELWIKAGGIAEKSVVIPPPVEIPSINKLSNEFSSLRKDGLFNFGMHQRPDEGIYSPILLDAYSLIENQSTQMLILGGAQKYRQQAAKLNLKNIKFFDATGDIRRIHEFLSCLNVYTHARKDGEQCSSAIIEAMSHGLPFVSHEAPSMGHIDQIGNAGEVVKTHDDYATLMKKMHHDNDYYKECSANSIDQYKTSYSLPSIINNYVKIYNEALGNESI